jgi:hypothetical protein
LSFQSLNRGNSKEVQKEAEVRKQPENIPIFIYLHIENITIFSRNRNKVQKRIKCFIFRNFDRKNLKQDRWQAKIPIIREAEGMDSSKLFLSNNPIFPSLGMTSLVKMGKILLHFFRIHYDYTMIWKSTNFKTEKSNKKF